MTKILVYGSLKKGFCNHWIISVGKATFLGNTTVLGRLFDLGHFPGFSLEGDPDDFYGVVCEAYSVSDATLNRLDALENHPDFYTRTEIFDILQNRYEIYVVNPEFIINRKEILSGEWNG